MRILVCLMFILAAEVAYVQNKDESLTIPQVELLQTLLSGLDYKVPIVDGKMGPATKATVDEFVQDEDDLSHDVSADELIAAALRRYIEVHKGYPEGYSVTRRHLTPGAIAMSSSWQQTEIIRDTIVEQGDVSVIAFRENKTCDMKMRLDSAGNMSGFVIRCDDEVVAR